MAARPSTDAHYLTPEQLRIGVYVIIELPWFSHPFALNNFKITDSGQLKELRALGLVRYRYDPDRTDPPPQGWTAPAAKTPQQSAETPETTGTPPQQTPEPSPAMQLKQQRIEALRAQREKQTQVEKAFVKASHVMRNLNRNLFSRPKETLGEMGELVQQMVEAFLESSDATLHAMGKMSGSEDIYYHSLNVTILAMMLAKQLDFTPESARELGIAALLHDIGKIEIPDRVLKKKHEEFNRAELTLYRMHVDYGIDIARKLGLSEEATRIIAQHHEFCDGTGYPKGLQESATCPGARLVSLVNFYDELCNPHDITKAMTPHAALSFMFAHRSAKFEKRALQLMVKNLGVYPPGSIVQLSNEAVAAVISVNPNKPLRPWILLYDASTPKEEALMLDLGTEPEIDIIKALSPALLPLEIHAYLNPRKNVSYFFNADSANRKD